MAHSCPQCDQLCHCGGDIDDCQLDGTKEQMNCAHCGPDDWDEDDEDWLCDLCGPDDCNGKCMEP